MKWSSFAALLLVVGSTVVASAQTCVGPTCTFTSLAVTGNFTALTGQNSISDFSQNGVIDLDALKYTSLQSAINAACGSSGGTVRVKPNYTETLSSSVTIPHAGCTIRFLGPATINMGSFQITMPSSYNKLLVGNISITGAPTPGFTPGVLGYPPQTAVLFKYTGSGYAFDLGDQSAISYGITISNIACDVSGSSTGGCFDLIRINRYRMDNVSGYGAGVAGQVFVLLDGGTTSSYTGDGVITNAWGGSFGTCIQFGRVDTKTGGTFPANDNIVIGGGCPANKNRALDFEAGSNGNIVTGYDVELAPINAVNLNGKGAFGNRVSIYGQGNNLDFNLTSDTIANIVENTGANCTTQAITVVDSGQNRVTNPCATPYGSGLPNYADGNILYCSNCSSSCGSGGLGRTCFREHSVWTH